MTALTAWASRAGQIGNGRFPSVDAVPGGAGQWPEWGMDRDRGTPHGATPPTPPGIRVTYHGGSIGLGLQGRAFGCWLRHQWFGPLVIADRGFTPSNRFQGQ